MALYDPNEFPEARTDFTLADVLAWARTKPADEVYNYCKSSDCAVSQFGRETGRDYLVDVPALWFEFPELDRFANPPGEESTWTFGAFADRLEAAL